MSKKEPSFTDYIRQHYYNEIFTAAEKFLRYNSSGVKKSYHFSWFSLEDIEVKSVYVEDLPDIRIRFDIITECILSGKKEHRSYTDDTEFPWIRITGEGDLEQELQDFSITSTDWCDQKQYRNRPLSDSLVPFLKKQSLDQVASEFLGQFWKDDQSTFSGIDPDEIAGNMGLSIIERTITPDHTVFGRIIFYDHQTVFYDEDSNKEMVEFLPGKTIVVDPKAFFSSGPGARNNTIIHECLHYYLHRKSFELERLLNPDLYAFSCKTSGGLREGTKSSLEWMEWQANALSPRVLMPAESFSKRAAILTDEFMRTSGAVHKIDVLEMVIDILASEFHVSRASSKIRLIDLGVTEAAGCYNYIDGSYVRPYCQRDLRENITYCIGRIDAAILHAVNPEFTQTVLDGHYIYVDGHYIQNLPEFIESDEYGFIKMTDYARYHIDECALPFSVTLQKGSNLPESRYHRECILNREKDSPYHLEYEFNRNLLKLAEEDRYKVVKEYYSDAVNLLRSLTNDYTDCMKKARNWSGLTIEDIAEKVSMEPRSVSRIFSGDVKKTESILRVLLAMKLPPMVTLDIMDKAPYPWTLSNENHLIYRQIICSTEGRDLEEIDRILSRMGYSL